MTIAKYISNQNFELFMNSSSILLLINGEKNASSLFIDSSLLVLVLLYALYQEGVKNSSIRSARIIHLNGKEKDSNLSIS